MILKKQNTYYKKNFGSWGECCVDQWMQKIGWDIEEKNLKIFRGEIDRIYRRKHVFELSDYCVAEIKTIDCKNQFEFLRVFKHFGLRNILKNHQIVNLYQFSEKVLSTRRNACNSHIFVRVFLVLKLYRNYEKEDFFKTQTSYRVCLQTNEYLILSVAPDFYDFFVNINK